MRILYAVALAFLQAGGLLAADTHAVFAKPPAAVRDGGGVKIEFAVDRVCEGSGFDVNPFGRVLFPNVGQFRIEVIYTTNNPLTTIGQYGKEDSGGPNARLAIPLAWATYVGVSDPFAG